MLSVREILFLKLTSLSFFIYFSLFTNKSHMKPHKPKDFLGDKWIYRKMSNKLISETDRSVAIWNDFINKYWVFC